MMPTFIRPSDGTELTAGQALDVWLAYCEKHDSAPPISTDIHLFADAFLGMTVEQRCLSKAGIEIRFEGQV